MRIAIEVKGLTERLREEIAAGESAVSSAMKTAGQGLKRDWRDQVVGAGLGKRLSNAIRDRQFPAGKPSIRAAALVWSQAPEIMEAFAEGALIRSASGLFLAIPTEAAGRGKGGRRITPSEWEARRGIKLRLVPRKGKPSLLVADGARINNKGVAAASRSKTGRGQVAAPIFILLRQTRLRKRIDLARGEREWGNRLPGLIVDAWATDKLNLKHGGGG